MNPLLLGEIPITTGFVRGFSLRKRHLPKPMVWRYGNRVNNEQVQTSTGTNNKQAGTLRITPTLAAAFGYLRIGTFAPAAV